MNINWNAKEIVREMNALHLLVLNICNGDNELTNQVTVWIASRRRICCMKLPSSVYAFCITLQGFENISKALKSSALKKKICFPPPSSASQNKTYLISSFLEGRAKDISCIGYAVIWLEYMTPNNKTNSMQTI